MATKEREDDTLGAEEGAGDSLVVSSPPEEVATSDAAEDATPANLGATKYVHAAFFVGGILLAFLTGRIVLSIWNSLAEWPAAVRAVPLLVRYAEDERQTFTTIIGALVGLITVVQVYRREKVRHYASEVASELSKVTWPNKEAVTNGTIVVMVASAVATVYVTLLDRFWAFLTTLVYGA